MFIKSLIIISVKSDRFTVRAILHTAKKRLHSVHYTGVLLDCLFHFVTFLQDFIELARRDSSNEEHVLDVYREDSTHIRINYVSLGRIKEIDFSNRKTEKRTGKNQSSSFQDHKETTSQAETVVTRKSDVKQQSQEKEKVTNGCSLWTFLKFMFFFLSFCLVHDNWGRIKSFIRRLWKK